MSYIRTKEHRALRAELIQRWKPWEKSTGPKTLAGKKNSSLRGNKGNTRGLIRATSKALRKQVNLLRNFGMKWKYLASKIKKFYLFGVTNTPPLIIPGWRVSHTVPLPKTLPFKSIISALELLFNIWRLAGIFWKAFCWSLNICAAVEKAFFCWRWTPVEASADGKWASQTQ